MKKYKLNKTENYLVWVGIIIGILGISTTNLVMYKSSLGLIGMSIVGITLSLIGFIILYILKEKYIPYKEMI